MVALHINRAMKVQPPTGPALFSYASWMLRRMTTRHKDRTDPEHLATRRTTLKTTMP